MSPRSPRASDLLDRRRFLSARALVARAGLRATQPEDVLMRGRPGGDARQGAL